MLNHHVSLFYFPIPFEKLPFHAKLNHPRTALFSQTAMFGFLSRFVSEALVWLMFTFRDFNWTWSEV